jgi:hypothetical protein
VKYLKREKYQKPIKKISLEHGAKFEVMTVMKIQVEVFWVVTLCSIEVGYPAATLHGVT